MHLRLIGFVVALAAVAMFVSLDSARAQGLKDGRGDVSVAGSCSGSATSKLRDLALEAKKGGVGYYQRSDFVHVDTGSFRTWTGK